MTLQEHWDKSYLNSSDEKLGWYETDLSPSMDLIAKTNLSKNTKILSVGAGITTLIDELLKLGYSNLMATDISVVALNKLKNRIGKKNIECIADDLTNPVCLLKMKPVDLWIDRAVLHFFRERKDQDTYFDLLRSKVKRKGYVIFAEFNTNGAKVCSGLQVHRYNEEMLIKNLGTGFELIDSFEYTYIMPSGGQRPYIYALFKKNN